MGEDRDTSIDLQGYFERIGWTGDRRPTLDLVRGLQAAHLSAIPFDGLDPFLKRPVSIDRRSIWDKLVRGQRGGYCYEQNGLFLDVLTALGFEASALGARVVYLRPGLDAPRTHQFISVTVDGIRHVVDVGFGPQVPPVPLPLRHGVEQATSNGTFRLVAVEAGHQLEIAAERGWMSLYHFTLEPLVPADAEMGNWFMSAHPRTLFVRNLMLSRITGDRRISLLNKDLTVRHAGGEQRRRRIAGPSDLRRVIEDDMLLSLPVPVETIWEGLPEQAIPAWP